MKYYTLILHWHAITMKLNLKHPMILLVSPHSAAWLRKNWRRSWPRFVWPSPGNSRQTQRFIKLRSLQKMWRLSGPPVIQQKNLTHHISQTSNLMLTQRLGCCKFPKSSSILVSFLQPVPFVQHVNDLFCLAIGLPKLRKQHTSSAKCIALMVNTLLHSSPNNKQHKGACSSFRKAHSFDIKNKTMQIFIVPSPESFGSCWFLWISQHFQHHLLKRLTRHHSPNLSMCPHGHQKHFGHTKGDFGTYRVSSSKASPKGGNIN